MTDAGYFSSTFECIANSHVSAFPSPSDKALTAGNHAYIFIMMSLVENAFKIALAVTFISGCSAIFFFLRMLANAREGYREELREMTPVWMRYALTSNVWWLRSPTRRLLTEAGVRQRARYIAALIIFFISLPTAFVLANVLQPK